MSSEITQALNANLGRSPTAEQYPTLTAAFDHINVELFDGALPRCLVTFSRKKNMAGCFAGGKWLAQDDQTATDEMAINPDYVHSGSALDLLQTIAHEMVHSWQHHFGKPGRGAYHNKEWAAKMEAIGLMPSDTGQPGGKKTGDKMSDYPIEGGRFLQVASRMIEAGFQMPYLDRAALAAMVSAGDEDGEGEGEEGTGTKPKKTKPRFTCPKCDMHAWAKPTAKLACGVCLVPMVSELDQAPPAAPAPDGDGAEAA